MSPLPSVEPARHRPVRLVLALGVAVVAAVVWAFDPTSAGFFPRCPMFVMTGLQCPGCGTTRALHALLHGDVAAAFAFNPFTMVLLTLGVIKMITPPVPSRGLAPVAVIVFAASVVFGVWRNLPVG